MYSKMRDIFNLLFDTYLISLNLIIQYVSIFRNYTKTIRFLLLESI